MLSPCTSEFSGSSGSGSNVELLAIVIEFNILNPYADGRPQSRPQQMCEVGDEVPESGNKYGN